MVLRFLMRYLANNEKLIQTLADSAPVRKVARFTARFIIRAKYLKDEALENIKKEKSLQDLRREPGHAVDKLNAYSQLLKKTLEKILEDFNQQKRPR